MQYKRTSSRRIPASRRVRSTHSSLAPRRYARSGYGAYSRSRPVYRKRYLRQRGAYYVKGEVHGSAKIPGFGKVGGSLSGGVLEGLGAYNISNIRHNVLIKPDIPEVRNTVYAEGGTIIRHREYLGPIVTSDVAGKFKLQSFPLNPAQQSTFPWLSSIAQNYEEYKPNGVCFEFRSTASDAIASSTNLALGQVMMCTQYDPTDPLFNSDVELLNYTWAQSGKVSDNVQHFVECDPKQSPLSHLYTRAGANSSDTDLRFSDFGTFSIATSGLQGTSVQVGQLWVTYEFILYKPKIGDDSAQAGGWYHFGNDVGVSNIQPFGAISSGILDVENNLNIILADANNEALITFPASAVTTSYMVSLTYTGDSTASVQKPFIDPATDPLIKFIQHADNNQNANLAWPTATATSASCGIIMWCNIPGDGLPHSIELGVSALPTSPYVDIYIAQIPYLDPAIYG